MKIVLKSGTTASLSSLKTDLLIIPVVADEAAKRGEKGGRRATKSKAVRDPLEYLDRASAALVRSLGSGLRVKLSRALERQDYRAGAGKRAEVILDDGSVGVLRLSGVSALSANGDGAYEQWRKLGGDAAQSARRLRAKRISIVLTHAPAGDLPAVGRAVSEGLALAGYEFTRYKSSAKKRTDDSTRAAATAELLVPGRGSKALTEALARAAAAASAVTFARDLVNTPPSDMNPGAVLQSARKVAGLKRAQIALKVYNRRALERMKARALLGVARGSSIEPYLLHLRFRPKTRGKGAKRVILIGKGITFDSGGLSIKTGKGMEDMKCDMAGAACVLGVMRALATLPAALQPKHEVHVIVPTAENMINGDSLKPGDVISAMNGKTIEVLNTDAEGRLILADALCYASGLEGDLIVDLATLTGACVVALGNDYAGMFVNDRELEEKAREAFEEGGEKVWPLPLAMEYRPQMESDVADIKNIGNGGPGAIIGALFLKEFVPPKTPWMHLDIAGPAFGNRSNEYIRRGATGFGVLSLLRLLERL